MMGKTGTKAAQTRHLGSTIYGGDHGGSYGRAWSAPAEH